MGRLALVMAAIILAAGFAALGAVQAEGQEQEPAPSPNPLPPPPPPPQPPNPLPPLPKDLSRDRHKFSATWTLTDHKFPDLITNEWSTLGKPFGNGKVITVNEPVETGTEPVHFFGRDRNGTYTGKINSTVTELSDVPVGPGIYQTATSVTGVGGFDKGGKGSYKGLEGGSFHVFGGGTCITDYVNVVKDCEGQVRLKGVYYAKAIDNPKGKPKKR